VAGRSEDLVEGRRRLRTVFILAVGLSVLADVTIDLVMAGGPAPPAVDLARLVLLLAVTFTFAWRCSACCRTGRCCRSCRCKRILPVTETVRAVELPDTATLAALDDLMEKQRCYREEGLTIAALAARLDLPEYRLRRLINQGLQYRNFSEFLNRYRLADVTAALSDPTQDEVPILTIALDAGFGSIGPFNRAFKAHTGRTPTEFRRDRTSGTMGKPAVSENALADSETGEPLSTIPLSLMQRRTSLQPPI
ncbi:MAG: helix-turn-helix domain-containing protein, partial [Aliidongia sp.]